VLARPSIRARSDASTGEERRRNQRGHATFYSIWGDATPHAEHAASRNRDADERAGAAVEGRSR
jgi:hypothetical protein